MLAEKITKAGISLTVEGGKLVAEGELTDEQRQFIRANKKIIMAELKAANDPAPMTPDQEAAIRVWLGHIKETNLVTIGEILERCDRDIEARAYFLERSNEVPLHEQGIHSVHCGDCIYFERANHPNLGHCSKGELGAAAGLWDTDRRGCSQWIPLHQNPGDPTHGY